MRRSLLPLILAFACTGDDLPDGVDTDDTDPGGAVDTDVEDTEAVGFCGDGVRDPGEQCDFGAANGPGGNCLASCVASRTQRWTLSLSAFSTPVFDAVGVTVDDAPLGAGAWRPADTNLNGDGLTKLQLDLPLYDGRGELGGIVLPWPELDQLALDDVFGTVRLSDLADVRFRTTHPEDQAPAYYLYLYTQPDGVDDDAAWYGRKLLAATAEAANSNPPADTWTTWGLVAFTNQLMFWDPGASGLDVGPGQSLATLLANPAWNWQTVAGGAAPTAIDYGAEAVKFVSVQTSSGSGTVGFDGLLDAVEIVLRDGRTFVLDLEP